MTTPRTAEPDDDVAPADAGGGPATTARLTVLQSFPGPRPTTNPYLVELVGALPATVRTLTFTWRTALTGRYDVLHLHWPEKLLRGHGPLRTAARHVATLALLLRLTLTRTPVVRTLHNVRPHEPGGVIEGLVLRALDRRTTLAIRLVPTTTLPPDVPAGTPLVTIPHAHYRGWYAQHPRPQRRAGRVLFFGLVRPYKGVEDLLAAFRALPGDAVSLRVVGSPESDGLARAVAALAEGDDRVGLLLEYVDEATLATEIGEAQLVVLPYRELHSSGAALLALSLDRPVLVPAGAAASDLAAEVGPRWVHTFDGGVTAADLAAALSATATATVPVPSVTGATDTRGSDDDRPDLSARDWDHVAPAHVQAYRTALARRKGHA